MVEAENNPAQKIEVTGFEDIIASLKRSPDGTIQPSVRKVRISDGCPFFLEGGEVSDQDRCLCCTKEIC